MSARDELITRLCDAWSIRPAGRARRTLRALLNQAFNAGADGFFELEAENEQLRASLETYGRCLASCKVQTYPGLALHPCTCGFRQMSSTSPSRRKCEDVTAEQAANAVKEINR